MRVLCLLAAVFAFLILHDADRRALGPLAEGLLLGTTFVGAVVWVFFTVEEAARGRSAPF